MLVTFYTCKGSRGGNNAMSFHQQSEKLLEVKQAPFLVLLRWWAGIPSLLLLIPVRHGWPEHLSLCKEASSTCSSWTTTRLSAGQLAFQTYSESDTCTLLFHQVGRAHLNSTSITIKFSGGLPGGPVVKSPPANAGVTVPSLVQENSMYGPGELSP